MGTRERVSTGFSALLDTRERKAKQTSEREVGRWRRRKGRDVLQEPRAREEGCRFEGNSKGGGEGRSIKIFDCRHCRPRGLWNVSSCSMVKEERDRRVGKGVC